MPSWWGKDNAEKEVGANTGDEIEVKAPKEITEKLAKIDSIEAALVEVKSRFSSLDKLDSFLTEAEKAKETARREEAKKLASKATEELEDKWIENPQAAYDEASAPLKMATINAHSLLMRREIFDDGKEFEYYHGDFKKSVDGFIDTLPPAAKADPQAIKNCYYLVLGQKQNEIREGKLKSKFAATSTSSAKTGDTNTDNKEISLSDAEKKAAAKFGIPEADYAKQMKELNYV